MQTVTECPLYRSWHLGRWELITFQRLPLTKFPLLYDGSRYRHSVSWSLNLHSPVLCLCSVALFRTKAAEQVMGNRICGSGTRSEAYLVSYTPSCLDPLAWINSGCNPKLNPKLGQQVGRQLGSRLESPWARACLHPYPREGTSCPNGLSGGPLPRLACLPHSLPLPRNAHGPGVSTETPSVGTAALVKEC